MFAVRSLTVRSLTVRSLTVRSLTVRSLTVHSLTVHSLTVRSLTVHSLTVHSSRFPGSLVPWFLGSQCMVYSPPKQTNLIVSGISLLLIVAALALGVWHASRFVAYNSVALAYRGPLDGQEGTLLHEARLILRGEPLYQPLQLDRVVGAPYPPVHAYTLAAVERLLHGPTPPANVDTGHLWFGGRLISLAGITGAALIAGLIVWRVGGNVSAALLTSLAFLATPPAQLWATRIKPDPLALLFTTSGLLLAAIAFTSSIRRRRIFLIWAALLFALAYFTKQTQIAAPLAVGFALLFAPLPAGERALPPGWVRRQFALRPGLIAFSLTYLVAVGASWLALDIITNGQFTFHVWGLHPPEWWIFGRFLRYAALLLPGWPLMLLVLCGGGLLVVRMRGRAPDPALTMALAYAALGSATLIGAGTIGSHHNHLLEPYLALAIGGGAAAGRMLGMARFGSGAARVVLPVLAAGLLVLQGWSFIQRPAWYGGEFDLSQPNWERFVTLIRSQPGEVLSDDVGLLLLAGKTPRYDDPPTMGPAARSDLWDQSGLLREIEAQRFDLVLLHFDATRQEIDSYGRWSPEFIAALRANYRLLYRDLYFSYVPAETPETQ